MGEGGIDIDTDSDLDSAFTFRFTYTFTMLFRTAYVYVNENENVRSMGSLGAQGDGGPPTPRGAFANAERGCTLVLAAWLERSHPGGGPPRIPRRITRPAL